VAETDHGTVSQEDFDEWLTYKVTKAFFGEVHRKIKELHIYLGNGGTVKIDNPQSTAMETAKIVGGIEELQNLLDIDIVKE